jgi:hypothetical protein
VSVPAVAADELVRLDGYPFEVYYSEGARGEAVRLAELAKDAHGYFSRVFPRASPGLAARFLTPDDWTDGYGMPSYDPIEKRLRVATDDNPFWQSFRRIARVASPLGAFPRLKQTYADFDGNLQLRRFFDLLVVHELAHSFEHQGGAAFPALWLSEIFANLSLHAFIANVRPSELANLTTFPEAQRRIAAFNLMMRLRGYRSLEDFERHYPVGSEEPMNGPNYGWYQVRFHVLAREVFDEDGGAALTRLWTLGQSEADRRTSAWDHYLEHRTLTGWTGRMRRRELAALLESKVSPCLGQAIAGWD